MEDRKRQNVRRKYRKCMEIIGGKMPINTEINTEIKTLNERNYK